MNKSRMKYFKMQMNLKKGITFDKKQFLLRRTR